MIIKGRSQAFAEAGPLPLPRVLKPTSPGTRRLDIQGLRAAAVILVVLFHARAGLSGGFVGVDVFFVLSGFVISGMLMREVDTYGRIRFRSFYLRRARRLLPALAVVSIATLIAAAFLLSPLSSAQEATGTAGVAASLFVANGYFLTGGYFNPLSEDNPFLHMWSLSVEEQFYLGFPLLLLFGLNIRRKFSERYALMVFVLVPTISFGIGICFTFGWLPDAPGFVTFRNNPELSINFAFFMPMARGWEFLAGALLALLLARRRPSSGLATLSGALGAALLCMAAFRLTDADPFPGWLALVPVLGTILLLIAGSGDTKARLNILPRLLSSRPVVQLGDVSYSWYLWHWPVIVLARVSFPEIPRVGLIAALISLAPAIASYRLVERPIHRGHHVSSSRASTALIISCLVLPLALGYGLKTAAQDGWGQPRIADIQAVVRPAHLDGTAGCASFAPLGSARRPSCKWTVPNAKGSVLLIGDSNAGQLTEPLIAAAHSNQLDAEVATAGGCPFILLQKYFTEPCRVFVEGSLKSILSRNPPYDAIVISNATVSYVNGPRALMLTPNQQTGDGVQQQAIAGWASGLELTLRQISSHSPVILVGAIPQYKGFPACLVPTIFGEAEQDCGRKSAEASSQERDGVVAAERKVLSKVPSRYLDTAGRLCNPIVGCSATYGNVLVYRDGSHLSVSGSYIFRDDLRIGLESFLKASGKSS